MKYIFHVSIFAFYFDSFYTQVFIICSKIRFNVFVSMSAYSDVKDGVHIQIYMELG